MEVIYLKMLRWQKINRHLLVGIHLETDALTSCENITEKKLVRVFTNTGRERLIRTRLIRSST